MEKKSPKTILSRINKDFLFIGIPLVLLIGTIIFVNIHHHLPSVQTETLPVSPTEPDLLIERELPMELPAEIPTEIPSEIPTPEPTPEPTLQTISAAEHFLSHTSEENFESWIREFSGERDVFVEGTETEITSRYSYAMFGGYPNAKAYEYLLQTLKQMVPEELITMEPYTYRDGGGNPTWYNVVITFPGTLKPDEQILYAAHFDSCVSTSGHNPLELAPGADDNGTGMAALLEALPTFAQTSFDRTLKVVFFSGEENFQEGSKAYVAAHRGENIIGMLNMDMFGNDADEDRCFEIHVGPLEGSDGIGQAVKQAVSDLGLDMTYDYFPRELHENHIKGDHNPFWDAGIPAVTVMENFSAAATEGGCGEGLADPSPNWHTDTDFITDISIPYAYDIARAGTVAALNLAGAHEIIAEP